MKSIHQERYSELIDTLIKLRKEQKLTQTVLATQLNKPQSYIAKVEGKDRKLDVIEFIDLCGVLGVSASKIISDTFETK